MKDNLKRWIKLLDTSGGNSKNQVKEEMEAELLLLSIPKTKQELKDIGIINVVIYNKDMFSASAELDMLNDKQLKEIFRIHSSKIDGDTLVFSPKGMR